MEKKLTLEDKAWVTRVRLAFYKSLNVCTFLKQIDKVMLDKLKQMLLEDDKHIKKP